MTIEMLRAAGGPVWVLGLGRSGQAALRSSAPTGTPLTASRWSPGCKPDGKPIRLVW